MRRPAGARNDARPEPERPAPSDLGRSFRRWGLAGLAAAVVVAQSLTVALHHSTIDEGVIILAAILTFVALATVTKRLVGAETLIYYHHEIAVVAVSAAVAAALGAPVLPHLDATVAGLGAFLAFGRIGCLTVGCCHGRPARRGVRYGHGHVAAGVPAYLQGVPLIPVQAFEAAGVAMLVVAAAAVAVTGAAPGTAAMTYLSGYAILRFALEELRGDTVRRYWGWFSEAQWTSLAVVGLELVLSAVGVLPEPWLSWLAAAILAVQAGLVLLRRVRTDSPLEPRRLRELQRVTRAIVEVPPAGASGPVAVWETPGGVRLSSDHVGTVRHVTLSRAGGALTQREAERLAGVIGATCASTPIDFVPGVSATYHVLLPMLSGPVRR